MKDLKWIMGRDGKFLFTFLTDILRTQGSSTPVDAFAFILQTKLNFAFHRTVWFWTSSLKQNIEFQLIIIVQSNSAFAKMFQKSNIFVIELSKSRVSWIGKHWKWSNWKIHLVSRKEKWSVSRFERKKVDFLRHQRRVIGYAPNWIIRCVSQMRDYAENSRACGFNTSRLNKGSNCLA